MKKEDKDMATQSIYKPFHMDEKMALNIISSPKVKIQESGIINDIKRSEKERLENARRLLMSRRCK